MTGFNPFLDALKENELEEVPVDIEEFIQSEGYLNLPKIKLSHDQKSSVLAMTQVYRKETLMTFMTPAEAEARFKQTCREVILQVGKGGGKDEVSAIACCYLVYLLLCLRDPAEYYGKPKGDRIDIVNIAINAEQALNVFFSKVSRTLKSSNWFRGKYEAKENGEPSQARQVSFNKNITLYSGHSEKEAWEGYNVIMIVLDEIAGFAVENNHSHTQAKTAEAIYKMCRASVDSRFSEFGKLVSLSFPRTKDDFIQKLYESVIIEKEVEYLGQNIKINPDLPDNYENNNLEIKWEKEHITAYKFPKTFALKRTSWEFNPMLKAEDFAINFYSDPLDAQGRFACMPPYAIDGFFKDLDKVATAFSGINGVDEFGQFRLDFLPIYGKQYYIHVDLAIKHDRCAVAMAHVDSWRSYKISGMQTAPSPYIIIDAIRYWTPTKEKNVDLSEVREYIVSLLRRGFDLKLVTTDRWRSEDIVNYFNDLNIKSSVLSVGKAHYTDMSLVLAQERLLGPNDEILKRELAELVVTSKNKIDHPRSGGKDLSDAVCGAIYNAIVHTKKPTSNVVEVKTLGTLQKKERQKVPVENNVIVAPKRMPDDLVDFFENLAVV